MTQTVEETTDQRLPLEQYVGKKVKLTYKDEGVDEPIEVIGTIEVANEKAVMIRPRGKTTGKIIFQPEEKILDYELDNSKPPELKQKELRDPTLSTVRGHLVDRHAVPLVDINKMDEEAAAELHLTLDHGPLSHTHPFIAAAEAEADGEESDEDDDSDDEDDEDDDDDESDTE